MLLILAACAPETPDSYDPDTWNSPLALQAEEEGDASRGETIFDDEVWNGSTYGITCASCHSADSADTLTVDADDWNRPGHTLWNVAWRGSWKSGQTWDEGRDDVIGAFGGQICVDVYYADSSMDAQAAADLEAFLRKQRDDSASDDDDRAQPLDFGFTSWDGAAFLSEIEGLEGEDLGDAAVGEGLADRHCGSCHDAGDGTVFYTLDSLSRDDLVQRIRKETLEGTEEDKYPNTLMPRVPSDRLSDDELKDLLAFLEG